MSRPRVGLVVIVMLAGFSSPLCADLVPEERITVTGDAWVDLGCPLPLTFSEPAAALPAALLPPRSEKAAASTIPSQTRQSLKLDDFAAKSLLDGAQLERTLLDLAPAAPILAQVTSRSPNLATSPPIRLAEPSSLYLLAGLGGIGLVWQCWRRYRRSTPPL